MQALIHTALRRPVDPEVEEQLAQESTVVRAFGEPGGKVRPPCGYGLLQAKVEARKVRALGSLMRVSTTQNFIADDWCFGSLLIVICTLSAALCVPAVLPVAGAVGELPGRHGAEAGQAVALRCQAPSLHGALGGP